MQSTQCNSSLCLASPIVPKDPKTDPGSHRRQTTYAYNGFNHTQSFTPTHAHRPPAFAHPPEILYDAAMPTPLPKAHYDWSTQSILNLLTAPLADLLQQARATHEAAGKQEVQKCVLLSVKTGGCPEDCGYRSQSARYQTPVESEPMIALKQVVQKARQAKELGATRFCMGTAWRQIPPRDDDPRFQSICEMVLHVAALDLEVCCTLGMASEHQLRRLKAADLPPTTTISTPAVRFIPRLRLRVNTTIAFNA